MSVERARCLIGGIALCAGSAFGVTDIYTYTGASETFVVPAGITSVTIEAWGAQGGMSDPVMDNLGGYATGELAVSPGDVLNLYVGGQPSGEPGGFNGGGAGSSSGAGGGGASDVRTAGNTLNDRVIVAGGGGGGGEWTGESVIGGVGGGLTGGDGSRGGTNPGGGGGTQSASANGTCVSFDNPVVAGGFGFGGTLLGVNCGCEGYGGGGGWYGGGGSGNCRGGGGGSSFIDGLLNASTTSGVRAGNGEIRLTYNDTYTVGGTLTGLVGSITLQNSGGDDLVLGADGPFTFAAVVAEGGVYAVTVLSDPVGQICSVTNGSGMVPDEAVTDVNVACEAAPAAHVEPPRPVPMPGWVLIVLAILMGGAVYARRQQVS